MLSSVLMYNLWQNIREEDLQHLWLIAEYGQLAAKDITPFQKLVFLVRDWYYPLSAPYGPDGGLDVLHQRLKAPVVQTTEMRIVREHIDACFKRKGCFLLPYPWREVRWSFSTGTLSLPSLRGRLSCLSTTFREQLQKLVRSILAPQNLLVKEVNARSRARN
ncbi:hypothetical protein V5799_003928 [Amblyomma americanum]|uniref:GB1/RHD3-type G domain-containing protein n=1 Tax=Amblyomma americanum TaxID=6943 RepID=A0AAQ4D7K0_AMBAM